MSVPDVPVAVPLPDAAVNCVIAPEQIVTAVGVTTGAGGLAFTVTVAVLVHPVAVIVPVTVYTVLTVGVAVTVAPVVALRPAAGDQLYVFDVPVAVSVTGPHWLLGVTEIVGRGFTVTVTVPLGALQVPSVLVTVYGQILLR